MELITQSTEETKRVGKNFAASLIEGKRSFITIALTGELGSGKTTFVQGFAEGLGLNQRIISPTFILMRKYEVGIRNQEPGIRNFYHIDLYRLENSPEAEARNIGLLDIWEKSGNIVIIEWAEKIKNIIPESAYWIEFEHLEDNTRRIKLADSL